MIIEMFGLPGSGKTVFTKKYTKDHGGQVVIINNKLELIFLNLLFFFLHPVKCSKLLILFLKHSFGKPFFRIKLINAFLNRNAKCQKAQILKWFYPKEILVLDEGQIQNIFSFFELPVESDIVKHLFSIIFLPDRLYIIEIPEDMRQERLKKRGYNGREAFGSDYMKTWEKTIQSNYHTLLDVLHDIKLNFEKMN